MKFMRKRRTFKKKARTNTVAKKVTKLAKIVKHLRVVERAELGQDEFSNSTISAPIGGAIVYIHQAIPTGAPQSYQNLKAVFNKLDLRVCVAGNGGNFAAPVNLSPSGSFRCLLVEDRDNGGALPPIIGGGQANILDNTNISGTWQNYMAPYNLAASKRYRILYDRTHVFKNTEIGGTEFRIKKTFKNKVVEYQGKAGTVGDAQIGQLFVVVVPDQILLTANTAVYFHMYSRLTYEANWSPST